ncbi:MAG TPA: VanZ family protein [Gemmatimonadaceae bacterium]
MSAPPPTNSPYALRHPRLATILSARGAYIAIILIATLTNLEPNWHDGLAGQRFLRALHPPFGWNDGLDAARNVLLFLGFGATWEVTTRLRLRAALWRATLYGFLLSATVEALQLFSPVRFSSIYDVITNTGGTFLGALAVGGLVAVVRTRRSAKSYLGVPGFLLALGLVGAVAMEAATPLFRQDYVPGIFGGPRRRLSVTLHTAEPISFHLIPRTDFGLSIPAGLLAVAALMELGMSGGLAAVVVSLGGCALAVIAELAHGITGEIIVWPAVVAHAMGIAVGAVLALVVMPRVAKLSELARVRLFFVAYAAVMISWLWRPFVPRTSMAAIAEQLSRPHWMPMRAFGENLNVFDVGQIIELGFLFVPLGALLETWPARDRGWMRWLMPGVWFSAVLVFGQVFIAARTFDITNFLIMVAGVWIGWWIARRAGVSPHGTWLPD